MLRRLFQTTLCWLVASPSFAGPVCFTAADRADFPVIQQAPPPDRDGRDTYPYYPATFAATRQVPRIVQSTSQQVGAIYWQWANHGPRAADGGRKGNITAGSLDVQIRFSSNAAANDCTMAQTAAVLGVDPGEFIARGALTATNSPQTSDTRDVCILSGQQIPASVPILIDYEVADGRSAGETLAFLTAWVRFVRAHGHKAILYTNPLDAPSQRLTQITAANAPQLAEEFDEVSVLLWSGNVQRDMADSFSNQVSMYRTTPHKIMIVFELNRTTLDDAKLVYALMKSGKAASLNLWRNHASQGGACDTDTNKKIACVSLGRCGG